MLRSAPCSTQRRPTEISLIPAILVVILQQTFLDRPLRERCQRTERRFAEGARHRPCQRKTRSRSDRETWLLSSGVRRLCFLPLHSALFALLDTIPGKSNSPRRTRLALPAGCRRGRILHCVFLPAQTPGPSGPRFYVLSHLSDGRVQLADNGDPGNPARVVHGISR